MTRTQTVWAGDPGLLQAALWLPGPRLLRLSSPRPSSTRTSTTLPPSISPRPCPSYTRSHSAEAWEAWPALQALSARALCPAPRLWVACGRQRHRQPSLRPFPQSACLQTTFQVLLGTPARVTAGGPSVLTSSSHLCILALQRTQLPWQHNSCWQFVLAMPERLQQVRVTWAVGASQAVRGGWVHPINSVMVRSCAHPWPNLAGHQQASRLLPLPEGVPEHLRMVCGEHEAILTLRSQQVTLHLKQGVQVEVGVGALRP
jgi:hypothetical protein